MDTLLCFHKIESYSEIHKKKLLYPRVQMNLKTTSLCNRRQTQKTIHCIHSRIVYEILRNFYGDSTSQQLPGTKE